MMELFIAESSVRWQAWVQCHMPSNKDLVAHCFTHGSQLAAALVQRQPAALVLDMRLPGMEPYTWISALRAGPWVRPLPLLLLVQRDDTRAGSLARLAGAHDIFRKGIDGDALRTTLQRVLPGKVWLVPPRTAHQSLTVFEPPAQGGAQVGQPAEQVVGDFLEALPVNIRLLAELPHCEPALANTVFTELAAECQAAGALAAGQCLQRLADRACKGHSVSAKDIDQLRQTLDAATSSMRSWLLGRKRLRSTSR